MAKKLIATQTASSSSSLEFTSGLSSSYTTFLFYFLNLHPSNDGVNLRIAGSVDGGSNYNVSIKTVYGEAKQDESGGTSATLGSVSSRATSYATNATLSADIGYDSDQSLNGILTLQIPSDSTYTEHWNCQTSCAAYNNYSHHTFVEGSFDTSTSSTINAIKFYMSSGNIDDGKIKLFGVS